MGLLEQMSQTAAAAGHAHAPGLSALPYARLEAPPLTQDLKPSGQLIAATKARFLELLRLRYSSPLFRLPSAAHIQQQLRHHNTGPDQARRNCLLAHSGK